MNSPRPDASPPEKFRELLRRHGQVGVQDHQHIALGGGETLGDRVSFPHAASLPDELDVPVRVRRDHPLDLFGRPVRGVSLDEDQLGVPSHPRGPGDRIGDVPLLVPRRNDNGTRKGFLGDVGRGGTGDDVGDEREFSEEGEIHQDPVEEGGEEGDPDGQENLESFLDRLEAGQRKKVLEILQGQPILIRLRPLHSEPLAGPQDRLPQVVVVGDDHAGPLVAQIPDLLEGLLDILQVADHVGEDDIIERFGEGQVLRVAFQENEGRVFRPGDLDHLRADVDPDPTVRREGMEQVPRPAPDDQH
jgi:hypothetical protein